MDDVDSVQAQIARNMIESGDWVTARLNGVAYLEKSPLKYWLIALSFQVFGVHDWSARLPLALSVVFLCWLTARIGTWAFDAVTGMYAGLVLATCVGLWLFTRILIPDCLLTAAVAFAMWSFLRALEENEPRPDWWAFWFAASIGIGLLLKGLIAAVFPVAAAGVYLIATKQLLLRRTWARLHPFRGIAAILLIAAPWHVLATLQNPPYFDWTMKSEPGQFHGFFWFYFLNEHVFRFLDMRYPRDYNTVPRIAFWLFHLLWLFPWSAYLAGVWKLDFSASSRAGRTRMLCLCWTGFLLVFFTFSTTQEYYSMPCYPALALLIACVMTRENGVVRWSTRITGLVAALAAASIGYILTQVWNIPAPGDISQALTSNPDAYTLSLGHMGDLTLRSFAYLKVPLVMALIATLIGASAMFWRGVRRFIALAAMMVVFLHAARQALVAFDPYMGSHPLAMALNAAPPGTWIADNQYYTFSSVFFHTNRRALLLNGRVNNLEYGSYAPGAPDIFLDDRRFVELWQSPRRYYLTVEGPSLPRIVALVGRERLHTVAESGGKHLLTNRALNYMAP